MKRSLRNVFDYLILTVIVSLAIIFVLLLNGNRINQIFTIVGMSLIYIVWGVVHHIREKSFYPKVGLEYLLYALLGCVLSIGLLI